MTKSFSDYDYDTDFDSLLPEENADLIKELQSWNDELFQAVRNVLADYYNISVQDEIIVKALSSDLHLAFEVYEGAERDTCVRDLLIDAILDVMEVSSWPMNCSSDEYKTAFHQALLEKELAGQLKILS